ncbi:hypothetical protein LJB98_00830 [Bacteroidales bacterium OttesenSCG-928-M11]|nr:hypothetical protein [Bacteroidales bacterium OttesenSCG-928-M11]
MRKITLLLMSFILFIGYADAQVALPKTSTAENPIWYYIQVQGSQSGREGLLLTNHTDTFYTFAEDPDSKMNINHLRGGFGKAAGSFEAMERQLWRFEHDADAPDAYNIINCQTGRYFNQYAMAETFADNARFKNKNVVILGDDPEAFDITDWSEQNSVNSPTGYSFIVATNPLDPTMPSLHQGNGGYDYCVVFEGASWGYGANSIFQFIEFDNTPLVVDRESIDFGFYKTKSSATPISVSVLGTPSLGDNLIEWSYDNTDAFYVEEAEGYNNQTGGKLDVYFSNEIEPGDYTGTLKIWAGDISFEVALSVKIAEESPVKGSDTENTYWYNMQYTKTLGLFVQEMGVGALLEGQISVEGETDDDAQYWKFTKVGTGGKYGDKYTVENMSGYQIAWSDAMGGFVAVETSDYTFSFLLRSTDGNWQLYCNEYEYASSTSETGFAYGASMYIYTGSEYPKGSFRPTTSTTSDACVISFFPFEDNHRTEYPTFSTLEKPYWYFVQFARPVQQKKIDVAFTNPGVDFETYPQVTQDTTEFEREDQHWILLGNKESFKFVSKVNNEELAQYIADVEGGETAANKNIMALEGEGHTYSIYGPAGMNIWEVKVDDEFMYSGYAFLNDFGGTSNLVGLYSQGDGGNGVIFTPVGDYNAIEDIDDSTDTESVDKGQYVGVSYYNLQGQVLSGEPVSGMYIKVTKYTKASVAEKIYKK